MTRLTTARFCAFLLALALLGFGCDAEQPQSEPDGDAADIQRTADVQCTNESQRAADNRSSPERVTQADLLTVKQRAKRFQITVGEDEGETLRMTLTPDGDEKLTIAFQGKYRLDLLRRDGALCIDTLHLIENDQTVRYNSPVVLIPATVEAGRSISSRVEAVLLEGGEVSSRGSCTHNIKRITHAEFNLPVGRLEGYLLDYEHVIHLPLADVTIELELGTDAKPGILYWRSKLIKEKLGLFGETIISQLELAETDVQ